MIPGTETVTIVRKTAGTVDDYGNVTESMSLIAVPGCLVGFGSTDEPVTVDGFPQHSQVTIYFPEGIVIDEADSFVLRGSTWVKDGRQMDWVSPFVGHSLGVVVNVRQQLG